MSRIVDDDGDVPIKTKAASQAYRENWDRIFGGSNAAQKFNEADAETDRRADESCAANDGDTSDAVAGDESGGTAALAHDEASPTKARELASEAVTGKMINDDVA
jgi:hypothetical protein